jgi:hypothetical protein
MPLLKKACASGSVLDYKFSASASNGSPDVLYVMALKLRLLGQNNINSTDILSIKS